MFITSRMKTLTQPAITIPRGNPPCQPQSTDGSSCGSTAGRCASSRVFLATEILLIRDVGLIVAQHGDGDDGPR
jgi:hypothetical protein